MKMRKYFLYLFSACVLPTLASCSSGPTQQQRVQEQLSIMRGKTIACKQQFPPVKGNFERRATCEASAMYEAGANAGISYDAINELAGTMKRLGAELDQGTISREDARIQLNEAVHKAYAHAASDAQAQNLELREHQEHCTSMPLADGLVTTDCSP
ncbi:hypothetical protein CFR71_08510 [Novacetimonas pomaceti]|uniref:Lipoprotein n=2 Tax=Novacetimonas pomaceti TaxID=2021998 RepID=A0A318QCP5_9PROT|nr:hypothetical protein CFR71_08510 [Novacetimonas pomaceti]